MRESVAIVGGGIAGVGAAWALHRSGFPVTVFEKADALGGNARTHGWRVGDEVVESPLLVIAWPMQYYHNYHALLAELGVQTTTLPLAYYVNHPEGVFRQDGHSTLDRRFERDFARWRRLIAFTGRINDFFLGRSKQRSMYDFSYFNPLNLVPLYWLARLFGVSRDFWDKIFVPVHASTLITTKMRGLPAVVAPLVESIVALDRPGRMNTWVGAPRQVFDAMVADFASDVHCGCEIVGVRREGDRFRLRSKDGRTFHADRVLFACQAPAVRDALEDATWLERTLLSRVHYVDDHDSTYGRCVIHSDASIFPEKDRDEILANYNTYLETDEQGRLECTFVLSAGNPNLAPHGHPMLVTFNSHKAIDRVEGELTLPRANPELSLHNLMNVVLFRAIQGKRGIHYCGSYTTPEGAHDLSFLSGLVAARTLGADYPFDLDDHGAVEDYHQLQRLMLGRVLPDRPGA